MHSARHSGSCGVGFVCHTKGIKSHDIVAWGVEAVKNLTHRGAVGADGKTGDGAGVLTQIPRAFFQKEIDRTGAVLSHRKNLAVGVFFLYEETEARIEAVLKRYHFRILGWRDVPTNDSALGESALTTKPRIRHLLLDTAEVGEERREISLYLARKTIEKEYGTAVYVPSLSAKTIVYKGLLVATHLAEFYPDLESPDFESVFCLFHQRFSTNTLPDWNIAQPFRALAHNGEINTIQGNRNWMHSLEHEVWHERFGNDKELLRPLVLDTESDSASLDKIIELLMLSGLSPAHAINMCIPPAWENAALNEHERAFFEYQSLLMKPWDGPAAVVLTDGDTVAAHLDRNGLRPLRYALTEDGIIVLGSEIGMVDPGRTIIEKGRLGPGETIAADPSQGILKHTDAIIRELAAQQPYKEWIDRSLLRIKARRVPTPKSDRELMRKQIAFGYTAEEIQTPLTAMATTAREMTYSMGDDTPLPPLAKNPPLLFRYFKQKFSQVTNPPIDYIRERRVMSLVMNAGYKRNFLREDPEKARRLHLGSPVLLGGDMWEIEGQTTVTFMRILTTFPCSVPLPFLAHVIPVLREQVVKAVEGGTELIILSDIDIARSRAALPSLLAVSAAFKALQKKNLANRASIIVETGEARDIHHIACLIGYGASAVYPYLALQTINDLCRKGEIALPYEEAALNYKKALEDGLLRVIARMGISTLNSYHGAQLFDTICLNKEVVDEFFTGTPVTVEADGLVEIEESLLDRHNAGFEVRNPALDYGGDLRYRKEGEWHAWSASSVAALNKFIKAPDHASFKSFVRTSYEHPIFLRHLLGYKRGYSINPEEVEPEEAILARFFSGAMSIGALSPEAHETIAEACNLLGIKSNSGEGGEDPARYWGIRNSAIKQVASGRFGVTPAYLASAKELEIKIAQGAKPGEGGHLPANKVTGYIAMLRHCNPGILLISPPPHHDIYSIEDLAQLINDLKEANPAAKVCVKLVAQTGVGTVAAGVAKAYADIIQISGCEGGTGASPLGSIRNAGGYWEIGLLETQRVLIQNGLRQRVTLRVDGCLRTGRDILVAALLGAEEFGFGTATMIATGCVMARQCHSNTCPTGIATQDERLRRKFRGTVEGVTAFFRMLARDTRERLAEMGYRSIDEVIGRTDLLTTAAASTYPGNHGARRVNLAPLFADYPERYRAECFRKGSAAERNDNPAYASSLNQQLVDELLPFIEKGKPIQREYPIRNVHRSVPARLNYHIALRYRDEGLPPDTLQLTFRGTAGQSFGAFNHRGVSLTLIGDANDYVGKGMFGGRIVIKPSDVKDPHRHVLVGNTDLYGAIGGNFYAAGRAGERFGVRNSGAVAVVEGAGHHLCEYMTRGTVVVLGSVGYNIGAGMTGGVIYLLDERATAATNLNPHYVKAEALETEDEMTALRTLIQDHYRYTESPRAGTLLSDFDRLATRFIKIVPL
ncbi:MAG: glutamate synthase large subunit [Nitrospirota bacterium]